MGQLNNLYVSSSFQGLLKLTNSTQGLTNTLQTVQGGDGSNSPLQMSLTDVNISGSFYINNVPITNGTNGTSGTSGAAGSSGTSGTGTSGTSGSSGTGGGGGDRNGLITTGSISDTQSITGSLIVTGSLKEIGNIFLQSSKQIGDFSNVSSSNDGNLIFGSFDDYDPLQQNGPLVVSGSNNIVVFGKYPSSTGYYGFISGSGNILRTPILLSTGSVIKPVINNNISAGTVIKLNYTTSSMAFGTPNFTNNLTVGNGSVNINHQSGSGNFNGNIFMGNIFTSNQNNITSISNQAITSNIINGTTTLNHISSSITFDRNISVGLNSLTVDNHYSSSVSANPQVSRNMFLGNIHTIYLSGSNTSNIRGVVQSFIGGNGNIVSSSYVGGTASLLTNTMIYGNNLMVSASSVVATNGGSTFVGRYNATGSLQESSETAVFVVGTGTGAGARRNALRIDNNNNSNFTGSVNISGSLTLNGNSVGDGNRNGLITTGSATTYPTQTINGSLQISSGSIFARGRNTSNNNLAYGELALENITTANSNTGLGNNALRSATSGGGNLAVGGAALSNMTTGINNVGIGNQALLNNISGSNNTAIGANTLLNNVAGFNLAIATDALRNNTTGQYNNAIGDAALYFNTIGEQNTAIGKNTLFFNTSGSYNIGIGGGTLGNNVSGSNNVAIGSQALANSIGSGNVAIGKSAGYYSTGSNQFFVGNDDYGGLSNEQNKSLIYGEFNGTTANQTLQINAQTNITNNLVVTGSVDIVGNFPGDPGKTFVISSGSMKMGDFNNSVRIADLNNQPQLFFNGTRKVGFFLGQSNMDQVDTQFGIVSGSSDIYTMGGNFNNFRSGSNNLMLGINNISIKSGSNNIILAKQTSYTTGSNNLILGSLQGVDEAQDYFNLQLPQSNDPIMFKSGSAPLTISGSLKATSAISASLGLHAAGGSTSGMDYLNVNSNLQGNYIYANNFLSNSTLYLTPNGTANVVVQGSGAGGLRISSGFGIYNTGSYSQTGSLFNVNSPTINLTGSVAIQNVLTLEPITPLPSGKPTGSLAVSGSSLYFYNGTWTLIV